MKYLLFKLRRSSSRIRGRKPSDRRLAFADFVLLKIMGDRSCSCNSGRKSIRSPRRRKIFQATTKQLLLHLPKIELGTTASTVYGNTIGPPLGTTVYMRYHVVIYHNV